MHAARSLTVQMSSTLMPAPSCSLFTRKPCTSLSHSARSRMLFPFHLAQTLNAGHLLHAVPAAAGLNIELHEKTLDHPEKMTDAAELTLNLLDWPRLLVVVSSFAGTASAKELIQRFELPATKSESEGVLSMTTSAIDLLSILGSSLDFGGIQSRLVNSCLLRLKKGFAISGLEAAAIAKLLQFTSVLQHDLKSSKEQTYGSDNNVQLLLDTICTTGSLLEASKSIARTIDEDGNVKDSASPDLQRARVQYHSLKTKVQELLRRLLREQGISASVEEIDGRFCIAVSTEHQQNFPGLLLRSTGSDSVMSYIEPVTLVSLNDQLNAARAAIGKAEYEALQILTKKLQPFVEGLIALIEAVIKLDVVVARAKFSLRYEGSMPVFTGAFKTNNAELRSVQLRQAHHPLLLFQYNEKLRQQKAMIHTGKKERLLKISPPVPIDITVSASTRVVTITGPNTGGKTAAMKTLGLAALMAKSGLYVLAKDPALLPWFDAVFADIGDEQSLFQSLSTFSGHLHRINHITKACTRDSLVLLDEVGTGTNPMEGAALGMSLLESFANNEEGGACLTIASTHHAELKTLKYSDHRFENASVEFDEATLKPTYRLLWGVPGRSCALKISERLGVARSIVAAAERHLGLANAEINQVIMDLENSKRDFENDTSVAEQYLQKAKVLHKSVKEAAKLVQEEEQNAAVRASNMLQEEAHKARASLNAVHQRKLTFQRTLVASETEISSPKSPVSKLDGGNLVPKLGSMVFVPTLGKEAKVVQVLLSKKMVVVQSGSVKLRLGIADVRQ